MLILKRIDREGIEVDGTDIQNRVAEKAKEFVSVEAVLQAELEEGGGMQRLRDMLLAERAPDYLLEKAVRTT